MNKISAFIVGTVGLSLAILVPMAIWWQTIFSKLEEVGLIVPTADRCQLWQGFAILALIVIISIAILMAFIVFGDGEKHVL